MKVLLFAPKFTCVCVLNVSVPPPIFTNRTAPLMFPADVIVTVSSATVVVPVRITLPLVVVVSVTFLFEPPAVTDVPTVKLPLIVWTFCFSLHLANGIRHLVWDMGYGFEIPQFYASGWITLIVAVSELAIA